MSGTALSDWALTQNPLQFTIQVAESLNCPLVDENDELSNCLRRKRLSDIMSVKVDVPEFQTPFGPIVDGSVVPNTPQQVMGVYQNLFTRKKKKKSISYKPRPRLLPNLILNNFLILYIFFKK